MTLNRAEEPQEPEAENAIMTVLPAVSTISGPDGRFTFHHLTRATYELEFDKPGYEIVPPLDSAVISQSKFSGALTIRVTAGELRFVLEKEEEDEEEP